MAVKFYNPGFKIREMMKFDHPTNDIKQENINSYWWVVADAKSFFMVPTEISLETINGPVDISVPFPRLVKEQYREHAVVMIDPKRDTTKRPIAEEDNVATNEREAKAKAELLWKDAQLKLIREHEDRCREARDAGKRPQRAKGNIKHALDALGIEDPANDIEDVIQRKQDTSEVGELRAQLKSIQDQMADFLAATKGK